MTELTMQVPDSLAARIRGLGVWFPQILELGLLNFATPTRASVFEVIAFLERNPTPQEVLRYEASPKQQRRVGRLLSLNKEGNSF